MKMIIKLKMINWIIFGYLSIFQWNFDNINGAIIETSGCYHNGTVYADRSLVPTLEPCLSCKCNSRMLICSLKVCPEMPVPPPRGCVLVHRKNSCCPYISCLKVHNFYNGINGRIVSYLNHYEKESIDRAVNENFLQRRSDDFDSDGSGEICIKNGTVYKSGSAMSSSSLCSYCYCIAGQQKCVKPKCMLPLDGCKAIFVDSTCCPVRYDCSTKTSGKSAHRSHARKTSNKHYLRISQRYQRNRGCTIGYDYYHEGQKMPNDKDSPCDICFCIRGIKKCAPKKCSPSLRYCIPVIPKGQCCPSSYECGSSRDNINRSYKSRQIGLFSLIFGSDDNDNSTESTIGENIDKTGKDVTSEKSIFDVIREGLEYIDSSTINLDNNTIQLNNTSSSVSTITSTISPITKKPVLGHEDEDEEEDDDDDDNFSFLDILLGRTKTNSTLNATTLYQNTTVNDENYNYADDFFDIFLGNSNSTLDDFKKTNNTLLNDMTTTSMYDLDSFGTTENHTPNDDYSTTLIDEDSTSEQNEIENIISTTDLPSTVSTTENLYDWTEEDSSTTDEIMFRTEESTADTQQTTESNMYSDVISEENDFNTMLTTDKIDDIYSTIPTHLTENYVQNTESRFNAELSTTTINIISALEEVPISDNAKIENSNSTYSINDTANEITNKDNYNTIDNSTNNNNNRIRYPSNENSTSTTTSDYSNEPISDDLFTSLLNGLSNLLGDSDDHSNIPNRTDIKISNILIPRTNVTKEKLSKKNVTTEIIAEINYSTTPHNQQHSTNQIELINSAKTVSQINNLASITTENSAVIIKTNPSILDLPYDYGHRTLPPSLPNLKIIPFLPVDALPTEKRQIGSSYPSIDRHSSIWSQGSSSFDDDNIKSSVKQYEHSERYPSITYSDTNIDNNDNLDSKIIYLGNRNGFSPPTKTEGGFVPREPIVNGNLYYDSKIIIELTTTTPPFSSITQSTKQNQEQSEIIAITSTDPFKDVIKAESPPDLISLIEDQENQKSNRLPIVSFLSNHENDNKNDKKIIHITTDSNYNLTPEYNHADERIDYQQNLNISNISFTEKMGLFEKINSSNYNLNKNYSIIELENSIDDKLNKNNNVFNNLVEYFVSDNNNNDLSPINKISTTIPPFKNLPKLPNLQSFDKFLIPKKSQSTQQPTINNHESLEIVNSNIEIITMPPLATLNINNSDNLSILEKLLLKTEYTVPDSELYKPIPQRKMTTLKEYENKLMTSLISTTNNPFKGLPLTQSYPVKPQVEKKINKDEYQTELDIILSKINKKSNVKGATYTVGAYKLIPNDATISSTDSYVINPIDIDILKKEQQHLEYKSDIPAQISSKSTTNNSINDPAGILLAGCNIYGRMYRVGKIISELSDDCLECKCTEIGVSCLSLKCVERKNSN